MQVAKKNLKIHYCACLSPRARSRIMMKTRDGVDEREKPGHRWLESDPVLSPWRWPRHAEIERMEAKVEEEEDREGAES